MLQVKNQQMQQMAGASPNKQMILPCQAGTHWIEFQLVDQDNHPVPGEPYKVLLPDQSIMTGTVDNNGKVRFESIVSGQASICFTGMDEKEWRPL